MTERSNERRKYLSEWLTSASSEVVFALSNHLHEVLYHFCGLNLVVNFHFSGVL